MILVNGGNITKSYGERTVLDGISFEIGEGDRVGLVGVNGAGKSTLFSLIAGLSQPDSGQLAVSKAIRIGHVEQFFIGDLTQTLWQQVGLVFRDLVEMEKTLAELALAIDRGGPELESLIHRQHELAEEFADRDGHFFRGKIRSVLLGLGFAEEEFDLPVSALSGGQRSKMALASMLLSDADLLLLDEPTNHLDIPSTQWLEGYLSAFSGAFVVISHDRYFLDRVTNRTMGLEHGRLTAVNGNYSRFVEATSRSSEIARRHYENTLREIRRIEEIIEQQRRWNREKNIRTAESKQKQIDRMKAGLVKPTHAPDALRFSLEGNAPLGGSDVLFLRDVGISFGDRPLFQNVNAHLMRGERVFLLGENGIGKTTLFRLILGELAPTSGEIEIGVNILLGSYDQHSDDLSLEKTVLDEVWDDFPALQATQVRSALAQFLFKGDEVNKSVADLSGGERARVRLLKLILAPTNFLLLDEPTNHLDIQSREALEAALRQYTGTMLIISHDRHLINRLADRVLVLEESGLTEYIGNYDDYQSAVTSQAEPDLSRESPDADRPSAGAQAYQSQKEQRSRLESQRKKVAAVEEQITRLESEIQALDRKLCSEAVATDYVQAAEITREQDKAQAQLHRLYQQWEAESILLEEYKEETI